MQLKSKDINLHNQTIVIFDGECVICNRFFRFLLKRDNKERLKYATLQSQFSKNLIEKHFKTNPAPDSVLLWQNGNLYTKSTASIRATAALGGIWQTTKVLLIFPAFLRNLVYDFIARNRYKWFEKQLCIIPEQDFKDRFLE